MSWHARRTLFGLFLTLALGVMTNTQARVPRIWDDRQLDDWATPLASLKIRPTHYSASEFYAIPGDNPGVTKGAVPGLEFLTKLKEEDKTALIAFLRSL